MKKYIKYSALFALFALVLSACTYEDGNTYRVEDVDAYSEYIKIQPNEWLYDDFGPRHYVRYSVPIITSNIINSGVVLVYMGELGSNANRWRLMPRTEVFFDRSQDTILYTVEWGYWIEPGVLEIEYFRSQDWEFGPEVEVDIKVVVIDDLGEFDTSSINFEDYDEVKTKFDIEEVALPNK